MTIETVQLNNNQHNEPITLNVLPQKRAQKDGAFLQSMLKSMRIEEHFENVSGPFKPRATSSFHEMLNSQPVVNLSAAKPLKAPVLNIAAPFAGNQLTALNNSPFLKKDDFIQSLLPIAKLTASIIGLDPKILIAQAALETGWGKFIAHDADGMSSNNLFNIKSTEKNTQKQVTVNTTEYVANTPIKIKASFKKYDSYLDSFKDYIRLITSSERYQQALANTDDPEMYIKELSKAGYATDPSYSEKILSIYYSEMG